RAGRPSGAGRPRGPNGAGGALRAVDRNAVPPKLNLTALARDEQPHRAHDPRLPVHSERAREPPSPIARLRPCNTGHGEQRGDDEQQQLGHIPPLSTRRRTPIPWWHAAEITLASASLCGPGCVVAPDVSRAFRPSVVPRSRDARTFGAVL